MRHYQRFSFFNFIYHTFGPPTVYFMKEWIKHRLSIYKCKLRIRFLKLCIQYEVIPPHVFSLQRFNVHLRDKSSIFKFNELKKSVIKRLLKIELNDSYRNLDSSRYCLFHLVRNITKCLPCTISDNFFKNQESSLLASFHNEKYRIDKKFKGLLDKQTREKHNNIKPIKYYWGVTTPHPPPTPSSNSRDYKFSLSNPSWDNLDTTDMGSVTIDPSNFSEHLPTSSLSSIRNNWFLNLSSVTIPPQIQCLLQLGENFSLPNNNKKEMILENIKDVENNIKKLTTPTQDIIRNRSIPIIKNVASSRPLNNTDRVLLNLYKTSRLFLKK